MEKLELDIRKIKHLLAAYNKKQKWIGEQLGVSDQLVSYWLRKKSLTGARRIAPLFNLSPKDLIK